jgi:hypothetical protein
VNFTDLLDTRPQDAVRLYLAERDSEPGVPTRILSPALTPTLTPTPRACFERLDNRRPG